MQYTVTLKAQIPWKRFGISIVTQRFCKNWLLLGPYHNYNNISCLPVLNEVFLIKFALKLASVLYQFNSILTYIKVLCLSVEKSNGSTHAKSGTVRRGFLIADLVILMIRRQQLGQRFGLTPVSHTTQSCNTKTTLIMVLCFQQIQ